MPPSRRLTLTVLAVAALAIAGLASALGVSLAASSAPAAKREQLGAFQNPIGAKGRTLGLSMVIIPTGVTLPLHFHEGTQVAYIQTGILQYTVKTGQVKVMQGLADQSPKLVRTIKAGQTATIKAGQWLVEQPNVHHSAHAKTRVIVLLATLLKNGAPAATPVQ